MIAYQIIKKTLRWSWLMHITDEDSLGFWKSYVNYLLDNEGGFSTSM